jgi:succinoglycan biosynthesis transport protein ExoP
VEKSRIYGSSKTENKTTINYLNLIKANLGVILTISLVIFSIILIYALTASDIYKTSTILKVSEPQGKSVLGNNPIEFAMGSSSTDRYIANEIEVMLNRTIREEVARVVIDSVKNKSQTDNYEIVYDVNNTIFSDDAPTLRNDKWLASEILNNVEIKQKDGLDFIEIIVESTSPDEASLIANSYAQVYRDFNLADSRKQLTKMKEFLASQRDEKLNELIVAEDNVRVYQIQGGGIELGQQALNLIQTTSQFEAEKNRVQIEMRMAQESLTQLEQELSKRDATVSNWLDSQSKHPEIKLLREEIAAEQVQKTKALASSSGTVNSDALVQKYDTKIANLNTKLNQLMDEYKSRILASSPDELKQLTQEIFQAELKYETLKAQYNQLNQVVASYDRQFNQLPTRTLELARLERDRQSLEKLYTVLEAKYQEALINEQSTPGNVIIMSDARPPGGPAKPNRPLLAIMGLILGFGVAFGYVFFKDYFDKTVKTPEDIEKESTNVLAWIPKFEHKIDKSKKYSEIFVGGNAEAAAGESYRTLRTRIQFSKIAEGGKSILITSSAPQEGKTTVASNLGC